MVTLSVRTRTQEELVDITGGIRDAVRASGAKRGVCLAFVPHTTAGITINEAADPDVARDLLEALARIVPRQAGYGHAEGNAAAHIRASLVGSSVEVPLENGDLALGTWQGIFLCEFDGPRTRKVHVHIQVSERA